MKSILLKQVTTIVLAVAFTSGMQAQGTWTQKTNKPGNATHEMGSFSINGKGYVFGGAIAYPNWSNETWEYDPTGAGSWTQKVNLPVTGLREPAYFTIGNKGYAGTGMTNTSNVNTFYEFDPAANTWTAKANFGGTARRDALGFSIGNKGYIGTGSDASGGTKDIWEYDPTGNNWIKKTDFGGVVRNAATSFSIGTKGYITTGRQGTPTYNDLWEYDPTGNSWTQKANFGGNSRSECVAFVINNIAYVGLGHTGGATDFWSYDALANAWSAVTNFPGTGVERFESVGFAIGNKGYVCAGVILGGGGQLDLWEFDAGLVGTNDNHNNSIFTVYPNPCTGFLNINTTQKIASLEIYDLQGEKLEKIKNNFSTLDLSSHPNGVYLVKAISIEGNFNWSQKIILQK